jgi:hypothetical protein
MSLWMGSMIFRWVQSFESRRSAIGGRVKFGIIEKYGSTFQSGKSRLLIDQISVNNLNFTVAPENRLSQTHSHKNVCCF